MAEFTMEKMLIIILVIIAFILFVIILSRFNVALDFWYLGCEGDVGGELVPGKGYANPICDILSERDNVSCEVTTYENITRKDGEELTLCVWSYSPELIGGRNITCFLNERLSCENFNQKTKPKCQDVPDCLPVSALKVIVHRLAPSE